MTTFTMMLDHQCYATPEMMRDVPQADLASRIQAGVKQVFRLIDRQRQRRALLGLGDHLLNDIGVSRWAAIAEGNRPFWK